MIFVVAHVARRAISALGAHSRERAATAKADAECAVLGWLYNTSRRAARRSGFVVCEREFREVARRRRATAEQKAESYANAAFSRVARGRSRI